MGYGVGWIEELEARAVTIGGAVYGPRFRGNVGNAGNVEVSEVLALRNPAPPSLHCGSPAKRQRVV
jgi:hypothetical protein